MSNSMSGGRGIDLYDKFLKELPPTDDEKSTRFSCNINDLFHAKRNSESSDHASDSGSKSGQPDSTHDKGVLETREFLKKVYEPVEELHGFDYDKLSMKMLLLSLSQDDSINLVGIVGMLGAGKTALARWICKEDPVKQRFVPRISITMRNDETMVTVAETMLKRLDVDKDTIEFISKKHKLPGLLYALHLQLNGKRYLIVLDDVQETGKYREDLERCLAQGHGFPKGCGGAVILTTRNEKAISGVVKEQNLHHLLALSDPVSCWKIYQGLAMDKDNENVDASVRDELKKKCGGLPLAARILGQLKKRQNDQDASSSKEAPTKHEDPSSTTDFQKLEASDQAPKGDTTQSPTVSSEADKGV